MTALLTRAARLKGDQSHLSSTPLDGIELESSAKGRVHQEPPMGRRKNQGKDFAGALLILLNPFLASQITKVLLVIIALVILVPRPTDDNSCYAANDNILNTIFYLILSLLCCV
ncbi:MAG: hypothetical protein MHPSP_003364 [Paramarteilia canceri]